jgi:hypothetical protein
MKKWFIILALLSNAVISKAHQPDIAATFLIEQKDDNWIFQLRGALTAFQFEIKTNYPDSVYASPEDFQRLVLQYVQDNLEIHFNENDSVILKNGFVKLGHETNVLFNVIGVPKNINSVFFKNSTFKDISRSQNALIILKNGFEKEQFILEKKNNHTVNLAVENSKFVLPKIVTPLRDYTAIYGFIGVFVLLVGVLIYFQVSK